MNRIVTILAAVVAAGALGYIALSRGETINAVWLIAAALGSYIVAYRIYARMIADRVFALDDARITPAVKYNDGKDYVPTNKWVLYGHHFAAIAGAGPLVGPTLAAQMGYLPGTLWIIFGAILGGAVQDFVVLISSMRRRGHSLGQMVKEEVGPVAGFVALIGVFAIMIILIAVLALVVVNALKGSPWGTFTIAMTIPIAIFMGIYMRFIRPGKVSEASIIGFVLLMLSLYAGRGVAASPVWGPAFTFDGATLALMIAAYGFLASVIPVWLLLAPRDYLSTFLKVGTIAVLAISIILVLPDIKMPATTRFTDGTGPVFSGALFPFLFITIACGAVSGFHALISSGTTPKMINVESDARLIGYGGMLTESFVAIMALIAATILDPGVYFAVNSPMALIGSTAADAARTVSSWGFTITPEQLSTLAKQVEETSILSRTGGAPSLALGMAHILSQLIGGQWLMAFWYHFAILFEAVFILTTVDAGTRVARFMLQDMLRHVWAPFGRTDNYGNAIVGSILVVLAWGYFLYVGVTDPFGGINTLWPLFGIVNQMLAAIALVLVTTVIFKMKKARYAWVTLLPTFWLFIVTMSAGWQKIAHSSPKIGFLAHAKSISDAVNSGTLPSGLKSVADANRIILNDRVDAWLTGIFMAVVIVILIDGIRVWIQAAKGGGTPLAEDTPEYVQLNPVK